MTAEGAIAFELLENQAASLMAIFGRAGYERVAPAFIQPAEIFLDRMGEALRVRTYVFTDPNGEELCLRPDLTMPVCRLYLERAIGEQVRRFCYNGPAFRMQEGEPDPLRPREFRQAGIELFGVPGIEADVEVLRLTLEGVKAAGLQGFILKFGHIGIFSELLSTLDLPERWRLRLTRAFWRPAAFARELKFLMKGAASRALNIVNCENEDALFEHLEREGIPFIGARLPTEVLRRLDEKAADAREAPLSPEIAAMIEAYLRIKGDAALALDEAAGLLAQAGRKKSEAIAECWRVIDGANLRGSEIPVEFAADFGRHFEYYTGMVFQIEMPGKGVAGQVGGGGRYDGLIHALSGGQRSVPAVGGAIHTERLLAFVAGRGKA